MASFKFGNRYLTQFIDPVGKDLLEKVRKELVKYSLSIEITDESYLESVEKFEEYKRQARITGLFEDTDYVPCR